MKKLFMATAFAFGLMAATPAFATHTKVYSPATANCVPPIVSLYWYHPAYAVIFVGIHKKRIENERPTTGAIRTPACWMGVASAALRIPHRKLYTPEESRRIRAWFRERNPPITTGTVVYK